ncbi:MAG: DVU0772 family protein [Desulfosudaceae bacterium]
MIRKLEQLKQNRSLVNAIDWDMTPEEAVRLYLEWGNNWAGGNYVIRSKNDVSLYFVVNTWKERPRVFLVRRNSEIAEELGEFELPETVQKSFLDTVGHQRGVYAIDGPVRSWLENELNRA